METEWEATFWPIEKDEIRQRLKEAGATLIYPERLINWRKTRPLPQEIFHHSLLNRLQLHD